MIRSFKTTNHLGETLEMPLASPGNSGLVIVSIDGLGPSKAEISLTDRAGIDGTVYNSGRATERNIIYQLKFLHDVETNRQKTYKYFPLKRLIRIEVETDNRNVYAYGYVESNEPDIFSNDEGCIISMLCPDAYLYDVDQQITVFSSVTGGFQFPFSNESLVNPLLKFGDISLETEKTIVYYGDVPIGMLIHIHANGAASGFTLTHSVTLETISIDSTKLTSYLGADISEGDDIYISTVVGNKYATLVRGGQEYNILNCLPNPTWFQLEKGDNIFAYTATSGLSNLEFDVVNDVAYEGI